MRRWLAVVSVVAIGAVGALSALPAGAGITRIEPNCLVDNLFVENGTEVGAAQPAPSPLIVSAVCTEVEVTKVVTGDPASGTTFDVVVECEAPEIRQTATDDSDALVLPDLPEGLLGPFEETLTFGEEGGTQTLLVGGGSNCTVSELAPPGCELLNINPDEFDIDYVPFFNGSSEVLPVPGSVLAVTVTNDCPAAVAAPAAVEITPRFTG